MLSRSQDKHIMFWGAQRVLIGSLTVNESDNVRVFELPEDLEFELEVKVELGVEQLGNINFIIPRQLK